MLEYRYHQPTINNLGGFPKKIWQYSAKRGEWHDLPDNKPMSEMGKGGNKR